MTTYDHSEAQSLAGAAVVVAALSFSLGLVAGTLLDHRLADTRCAHEEQVQQNTRGH